MQLQTRMTLSLLCCRCKKMSRSLQKREPFDQRRCGWEATKQACISKPRKEANQQSHYPNVSTLIVITAQCWLSLVAQRESSDVVRCRISAPRLSAFILPGFTSSLSRRLSGEDKQKSTHVDLLHSRHFAVCHLLPASFLHHFFKPWLVCLLYFYGGPL